MGPEQALRHTLFRDSNMNADDIMERKRRKSRKPRENSVAEKSSVGLALLHNLDQQLKLPWSRHAFGNSIFRLCFGVFRS
jgi:hypothetical protein